MSIRFPVAAALSGMVNAVLFSFGAAIVLFIPELFQGFGNGPSMSNF